MSTLSEQELNSLKNFWFCNGDLDNYIDFKSLIPRLQVHHPELLHAWYNYKQSIETLNQIIGSL